LGFFGLQRLKMTKGRGTFKVKRNRRNRRVEVRAQGTGLVSRAGTEVLYRTAAATGLADSLTRQLRPFQKPRAEHDPGKIILDLVVTLAAGGRTPSDVAMLRGDHGVFGAVASDPTISRLIHHLADEPSGLAALQQVSALARKQALRHQAASGHAVPSDVIVDIDATLINAHSEKQDAAPNYKRGFGFHPLLAYADHGPGGTGEPLAGILRPGNANAGTGNDHDDILDLIQEQLTAPETVRLVVRTDTAACNHQFLNRLTRHGHGFSIGFYARGDVAAALDHLTDDDWVPTINDDDRDIRDGGWIADITHLLDLSNWPAQARIIARKERPHPGAQLRLTDVDGHRITCITTNSTSRDIAGLDLRHRRRARCEDRIRNAKDTGAHNLPYQSFAANQIWLQLVLLAQALTAHLQQLALTGSLTVAEPKRLRLHLFSVAARLIRTGRKRILDLDRNWPWTPQILRAITRLDVLTASR
jgi:Transposase DDE domain group 1